VLQCDAQNAFWIYNSLRRNLWRSAMFLERTLVKSKQTGIISYCWTKYRSEIRRSWQCCSFTSVTWQLERLIRLFKIKLYYLSFGVLGVFPFIYFLISYLPDQPVILSQLFLRIKTFTSSWSNVIMSSIFGGGGGGGQMSNPSAANIVQTLVQVTKLLSTLIPITNLNQIEHFSHFCSALLK